MADATTLVSVDEYLHTDFEDGDREYVDGVVVERNLGERDHSVIQKRLILWFGAREANHGYYCFPEQRVQISDTRFRVPDICVYLGAEPQEQVFRSAPFLAIEILSPRDTFSNIQEKIDDYLAFGVPFVWVVDPKSKRAFVYTPDSIREAKDGFLRTSDPEIALALAELF